MPAAGYTIIHCAQMFMLLLMMFPLPTWVHDLCDIGRGAEKLGYSHRIPLVFSHANMEGLQSSVGQEAVKGAGYWPRSCEVEGGRRRGRKEEREEEGGRREGGEREEEREEEGRRKGRRKGRKEEKREEGGGKGGGEG